MFTKASSDNFFSPFQGIEIKTLAYGKKTLMTQFNLKKGSQLPRHSHPHEQTGYLVSGQIRLCFNDKNYLVNPGDAWSIEGDREHWAEILEDSVAIEVFSPVREDYLPENLS